jgi:transposase-like protein
MSIDMDEEIKRWTARRRSAVDLDIIQGKTTVSESSRQFDLPPSEIESWIDQAKAGMENALKAKPEDIREQYESQLKALQEAYGEASTSKAPLHSGIRQRGISNVDNSYVSESLARCCQQQAAKCL